MRKVLTQKLLARLGAWNKIYLTEHIGFYNVYINDWNCSLFMDVLERVTDACASIGELVVKADLALPKEHNIVEFRSKENER